MNASDYREYSAAGNVLVGERFDSHLVHQPAGIRRRDVNSSSAATLWSP